MGLAGRVSYCQAVFLGAASQRNEGVTQASQPFILFLDDDILPEPDCIKRLWTAMEGDARLGGVNATITNQQFHPPGRVTHLLYRLLDPRRLAAADYAGRVLGPGVNLLPADRDDLPEVVPVEWLNTTCTLYRREALPDPPFPARFTGYSLMEDLALSLIVGKTWKLANARTARIFHDSQPGTHKDDAAELARMELVNRHYVMSAVLGRRGWVASLRLAAWEFFQVAVAIRGGRGVAVLRGKLLGLRELISPGGG